MFDMLLRIALAIALMVILMVAHRVTPKLLPELGRGQPLATATRPDALSSTFAITGADAQKRIGPLRRRIGLLRIGPSLFDYDNVIDHKTGDTTSR